MVVDTEITVQVWSEEDGSYRYSIIQSINDETEVLAYGEADTLDEAMGFAKDALLQAF